MAAKRIQNASNYSGRITRSRRNFENIKPNGPLADQFEKIIEASKEEGGNHDVSHHSQVTMQRPNEMPDDSSQPLITTSLPLTPSGISPVLVTVSNPSAATAVIGLRRSERIKNQKLQALKKIVVLGQTVRDSDSSLPSRINEQLVSVEQVELINEKFLKSEGLNFKMIRQNIYKCSRMVSKEIADMQCECFLTVEEVANGQWGCGEGCINRMLMIECGPQCSNKERCTNTRFQRQLCSPCRVFRTEKKGCGIVAEVQINPGDFIMEYMGEVIDYFEFVRRSNLYAKRGNRLCYAMMLHSNAAIDSTNKGNISRFMNHSCDPNAETQKWTVNGVLRIGFFCRKTILSGEEITFNYEYQRFGSDAQPCFCEASNCRRWIGEKPSSDSEDTINSNQENITNHKTRTGDGKGKISRTNKQSSRIKTKRQRGVGRTKKSTRSSVIRKASSRSETGWKDPTIEEEVSELKSIGLQNEANTLQLSRLMVRAKLLQTRLKLLEILQHGEISCRRLFLDYQGLRLLNGWINGIDDNIEFGLAMVEALESLPIPNKTMLNESKIFQTIKSWNNNDTTLATTDDIQDSTSSEQIKEAKPPHNEVLQKRINMLINKWNSLPDIFGVPNRERIEQVKVHEREAVSQTKVEDSVENLLVTPLDTTNRFERDHSCRDTSSHYVKPSATPLTNFAQGNKYLPKEPKRKMCERMMAHDKTYCNIFGFNEIKCNPVDVPFSENLIKGEFFNTNEVKVPPPPIFGYPPSKLSMSSNDPTHYELPEEAKCLPILWTYKITPEGYIYYINLIDERTQWEPPFGDDSDSSDIDTDASEFNSAETVADIDEDCENNLNNEQLEEYIKEKNRERRQNRYKCLVSVRETSPNHKDNRRNEIYSRSCQEVISSPDITSVNEHQYSSKDVDKLLLSPLKIEPSTSKAALSKLRMLPPLPFEARVIIREPAVSANMWLKRQQPEPEENVNINIGIDEGCTEAKRRRIDGDKKRAHINSRGNEILRLEICKLIYEFLKPYRKDTCPTGRITNDNDFTHLRRKLTHYIITKELKYNESIGRKPTSINKSKELQIRDYLQRFMHKYGKVYNRKGNASSNSKGCMNFRNQIFKSTDGVE